MDKIFCAEYVEGPKHTESILHGLDLKRTKWGRLKGHRPPKVTLELVIRVRKFGGHRSVAHFRGPKEASCLAGDMFQNRMISVA